MVRILPSGEIVPDNDPRAQRAFKNASDATASSSATRRQIGGVTRDEDRQDPSRGVGGGAGGGFGIGGGGGGGGEGVNIFQALNQRLLDAGVPRVSLWRGAQLEPLALVGCILAVMMFGLNGLLFAGVLYAVVHYSSASAASLTASGQANASEGNRRSPRGGGSSGSGGGGGRVLGRH